MLVTFGADSWRQETKIWALETLIQRGSVYDFVTQLHGAQKQSYEYLKGVSIIRYN